MPPHDSTPDSTPNATPRRTWLRVVVIAAVVLSALAIFAVVARRTFLRHEFDLSTLIDDSAGIKPSSPVMLNGIDVGHVVGVVLSGSPDPNKTVRITMRFPRRILTEIPADSTAAITSANVLGDKYIDVSRGRSPKAVEPGAEIVSSPTQDISTALSRANAPLNQVSDILAHIDKILAYVSTRQGTLGKFLNDPSFQKHITTVSGDQTQLIKDVNNGRGVIVRFHEISAEVQKPIARINAIETDFRQGSGSAGRFLNDPNTPTLTAQADSVMKEARQLMADFNAGNRTTELMDRIQKLNGKLDDTVARVDSGQGTLGQWIVNPQLRDSLHRVSEELNRLTADFSKHPTRFVQIRLGLF
jgi:phospholipid/cholesterol/gamma-HCH transport system substrate-binding protein